MTTTNSNGSQLLRREILDEAGRQRDQILKTAQETVADLLAKAEQAAEQAQKEKLEAAEAEAKRRRESILATVAIETGRMRLARTEQLLQRVRERACERLGRGQGFNRRDAVAELAAQALTRMTGRDFVLRLSSGDLCALGGGLVEEVRRRWTRPWLKLELRQDSEVQDGDWILQDQEGRQLWDLGLKARLDRLWPDLRRQIAVQSGLVDAEQTKGGRV